MVSWPAPVTQAAVWISGTVFEDVDFAGSATNFGPGDQPLPNVDVELYDNSDAYIASAATDINGQYSFGNLLDGTYKVRVRSATIGDSNTPPAGGFTIACGVTDPPSGTPCALAELTWADNSALYGGQSATADDTATADNAGPGDTFTTVTISGADLTGVNFGVAYDLIVNTADSGQGSLRRFIQNANAIAGTQTSQFRIPLTDPKYNGSGHGELTIRPLSALPSITDPIILDGSTQTANIGDFNGAGPEIEIDGSVAGLVDGLSLIAGSSGSTIRAVVINRFSFNGINASSTGSLVIQGTYIGTDVTGTMVQRNWQRGIYLNDSPNNTIGGTTAGAGNLISGNGNVGLSLFGPACTANVIQGNLIGTDRFGMLDLGNFDCGVLIEDGASSNTIGGSASAARNIISGNYNGLVIRDAGSNNNTAIGNYFGLATDGATPVGNTIYGVLIGPGASGNIIGGSQSVECNVIAGNTQSGLRIDGSNNTVTGNFMGLASNGATPVPNGVYGVHIVAGASGNVIGGNQIGQRNVIAGNTMSGLYIEGSNNTVTGNFMGLAPNGADPVANGVYGVHIAAGASGNVIGGDQSSLWNVIAGNTMSGLYIEGSNNTVTGNFMGLASNGADPVPNGVYGVHIVAGASGNVIGGNQSGQRNVIAGNSLSGLYIEGSNNTVTGNFMGLASNGADPVANGVYGVHIAAGASGNVIGGDQSSLWNVIAGNTLSGLRIDGSNNTVTGNFMGLASNGATPVANGLHGIHVFSGATGNTIGGSQFDQRNVIAGNTMSGILIEGSSNTATGNYIGFGADSSTPVGNGQYGIYIASGAVGNRIGGSPGGEMNVIGYSGNAGVAIAGTDNAVVGNRIFNNGGLGIDLLGGSENAFGVTANDAGDVDSGPNDLLNFPVITWTAEQSGNTIINFDLDVPGGNYRIEFFRNPSGTDPSGYGEGEYIAGSTIITHPGGGLRSFNYTMSGSAGEKITATAIVDMGGGTFGATSEFSAFYTVLALPQITISKSDGIYSDPVNGTTSPKIIPGALVDYSVDVSNQGPGESDSGTVMITNEIANQTVLFVGDLAGAGSGPVEFIDGSPISGLSYTFDSLASTTDSIVFSNDNGATYTYTPVPGGDGCDPQVTHLRVIPTGIFNGSDGTNHPSFVIRYRVGLE